MQANENDARFAALVQEHEAQMLAVARRVLRGNEEEARDAVQDALLAVVRSLDSFRAEAQLSTWLFRIVVNAALMRLRAGRRHRARSIDELLPTLQDAAEQPSSGGCSAYALLETKRTRQAVHAAIERLPQQHRTIIQLRDIEERSTRETAERLGISPCAVKLRLLRARRALRTILQLAAAPEPAAARRQRVARMPDAACVA
ncbi:MAG: sigma-70 family RNA polymerase sigma factor [bacterium]